MAASRKVELRCDLCSKKVITEYDRDENPILPIGWIEIEAQIQTQFFGIPTARIRGMHVTVHACPKHKSLPLEKINR
jgi:hypothetical protein